MSFWQALRYFFTEATISLLRSWKVALLAIFTIAVSLVLGGMFLLVSSNLGRVVEGWQSESKVVVYFETGVPEVEILRIRSQIAGEAWTTDAVVVSSTEARRRFESTFPSLSDLLDSWGEEPLPSSIEITLDWNRIDRVALRSWAADLEETLDPVSMVDDDQDWLSQLEGVVLVLRGLGLIFGGILLVTAVFTISSVIRLTAFLYREEIAVMRMVGATEFYIRGPFYVEGFLQGLTGAAIAVATLWLGHDSMTARYPDSLALQILAESFLSGGQVSALLALGAVAGLVGAITSVRREGLGRGDWSAG